MALLVDGDLSSFEDLKAQDSSVMDVAAGEHVDLEAKLKLAWEELNGDVERYIDGMDVQLEQIAVSAAMRSWHVAATLESVYQDAYFSQLNDRYGQRWRHWIEVTKAKRERLFDLGLHAVDNPLRRPTGLAVDLIAGELPMSSYWFQATYVSDNGAESAPSPVKALSVTAPHGLAIQLAPGQPKGLRWNLYAGTSPAAIMRQNEVPLYELEVWVLLNGALGSGAVAGSGQSSTRTVKRVRRNRRG